MNRLSINRPLVRSITLLACALLLAPVPAQSYSAGLWLYEVEAPVAAQSQEERQRVASLGLLQVLSRVTGLRSIPRNEVVTAALANPGRYYNEFVFFNQRDELRREQPHLRIVFQRDAVLELARSARLPIWWNRRPDVMLWVVVETQGRRQILDSNSTGELVEAVRNHAERRGLPVILPLMDLDDRMTVSSGDVWGRVAATLEQGARRYDADLVLVGRLRAQAAGEDSFSYRGDWEVWQDGRPLVVPVEDSAAATAAAVGLDALADQLAERFTVLPRGIRRQQFAITGLRDVSGYAGLMTYLSSLDFIEGVSIASLQTDSLNLQLDTHAGDDQLIMMLTAEGRLQLDESYRGAGTGLVWRD
ncbi:MAG: DUF2066 domain-containing protein [Pseudomonadota bacterium]